MLNWFKGFINQRYFQVCYGSSISKPKQLQLGLPQGAITSCSLFNVYINDLVQTLSQHQDIKVLLYVDDLVLWTAAPKKIAKQTIENSLNSALCDLSKWFKQTV